MENIYFSEFEIMWTIEVEIISFQYRFFYRSKSNVKTEIGDFVLANVYL